MLNASPDLAKEKPFYSMLIHCKGLLQRLPASITVIKNKKNTQGLKIYNSLLDIMTYNIFHGIKYSSLGQ